MSIAPKEIQIEFDQFMLSEFRRSKLTMGRMLYKFLAQRGHIADQESTTAAFMHQQLVSLGVERIPSIGYWRFNIGKWLMDSYPQFERAVVLSQNAMKIPLHYLKFAPRTAPDPSTYKRSTEECRKVRVSVKNAALQSHVGGSVYQALKERVNHSQRMGRRGGGR